MLIVQVDNKTPIEKALKLFKSKVIKTKLMSELRNRKEFTKPSITKRKTKNSAIYREQMKKTEN
jgi:small subunit ribosomal protein S21